MRKLLLLLVMILLPMVSNAEAVNIDGIYYNLPNLGNDVEVTSHPYGYKGSITIPETVTYKGVVFDVTSIGNKAFEYDSGLTSVTIPNSIKSIGIYAFYYCSNLTSITIPNSVTSIANYAFAYCTGLTSITIPNSVTSIGELVFANCTALTSVTIPNGLTFIGNYLFDNCTGLTSVTISNSVISIGDYAFHDCKGLTSVTIPNSVTSVGTAAFSGCKSLTSVTIPNNVTFVGRSAFEDCQSLSSLIISNNLNTIEGYTFKGCGKLKSVTIPPSVTSIADGAFSCDSSLVSLVIPSSVTKIEGNPFRYCKSLTSIIVESNNAVYDSRNNCNAIIHTGTNMLISGCNNTEIPSSVMSLGSYSFGGSGLISITIPNGVTSIGSNAFYNCTDLTAISISQNVTQIMNYAFASCTSLTDVFCYNKDVPNTSANAFDKSNIEHAILHVPSSSMASYKFSPLWGSFKDIVKLPDYSLIYKINEEVYKSYKIEEGEAITPEAEPTKEGYTFSGWSEIPKTMPAHDVTVTGTFNVNKYKLIYQVDGVEYKTYEVEYGAAITAEVAPTKENYTFSGWSELPATMPAHDVTVTGTFTINKYKLIYKVDGADYKTYEVEYGAIITAEAAPTKEGHTFFGWSEIPETMPANDVTVIGTFSVNKYKLIYKVDGSDYKTYEVEYGATITPEEAPTKEGHSFSGWSEIPTTMPANDVTVTGTFSVNKYKLIYKVDGADYKTYEVEYGASITPEAAPTNEGYTFSGWSEIPKTMPAHDVTVTGTFNVNKYKLIYQVDGVEYKTYEVEYGATITPEAAPTKEGYNFSGWSYIPETMPAQDVTVIGTFTKGAYKLIYMVDGEVYKTISYDYGASITPEAAPTKEGYTFSGWSYVPSKMPAEDVTVTGTFSINKYKLMYKVDGADYKSYDIEYGATITPEEAPTKEGHTFSGWSEIPETMPAHDVTVTGTFTKGTYKLIYMVDGEVYKTISYDYGASVTPEAEPTKEGYTFTGWSYIPSKMPAEDVTVTGFFKANKYKLIYKVDGADYKTYDVEYGATITPETEPTKEGYTFSGWSEIPETMPAHDVTVTGTFTQVAYEVGDATYEVNGDNASVTDGSNYNGEVVLEATVVINGQSYTITVIADDAFKGNQNITSVTIPNSVTSIGASAFEGCNKLSAINIGKAVASIGSRAFANMSGASQAPRRASGNGLMVQCNAESVPSIASDAFANTPINNATLLVLDNLKTLYMNTAPWSGFGKIMGINEYTGIEAIIVDIESGAKIYSLDGKPQDSLQKGVNIVRMKNGTMKKVVVK